MLVQNQVGSAAEGIVFVSVASYNECVIAMRPGTLSSMAWDYTILSGISGSVTSGIVDAAAIGFG